MISDTDETLFPIRIRGFPILDPPPNSTTAKIIGDNVSEWLTLSSEPNVKIPKIILKKLKPPFDSTTAKIGRNKKISKWISLQKSQEKPSSDSADEIPSLSDEELPLKISNLRKGKKLSKRHIKRILDSSDEDSDHENDNNKVVEQTKAKTVPTNSAKPVPSTSRFVFF